MALGATVGFDNLGNKLSSLTESAKIKVLGQLTDTKAPFFASPFEYKIELPYLANKVSEAEKEMLAAEQNVLAQQAAAAEQAAAQQAALEAQMAAEQAAAEQAALEAQMATEKAALEEKMAAELAAQQLALEAKLAAEKAVEEAATKFEEAQAMLAEDISLEQEMAISEEIAAAEEAVEEKIDEAMIAQTKAEVAKEAVEEFKAEDESSPAPMAEGSIPPIAPIAPVVNQIISGKISAASDAVGNVLNGPGAEAATAISGRIAAASDAVTNALNGPGAEAATSISGKVSAASNAFGTVFKRTSFGELMETNKAGATASLITAGVAAVGTVLRVREDKMNGLNDDEAPSPTESSTVSSGSYLDSVVSSGSSKKESYAPFGNYKTTESSSSSLYSPPMSKTKTKPSVKGAPSQSSVDPKPTAVKKVVKRLVKRVVAKKAPEATTKMTEKENVVNSVPLAPDEEKRSMATSAYGSYLDSMSGSGSSSQKPSSYSPFGSKYVESSSGNALYAPPIGAVDSIASTSESVKPVDTPEEVPSSNTAYGSYLDNLNGSMSDSVKPASYSPFGNAFKTAPSSSNDSLYAPPVSNEKTDPSMNVVSETETVSKAATVAPEVEPEAPPASYGSYLEILSGSASGSVRKSSYSPFGATAKSASSSSNDSLYSPPDSFKLPDVDVTSETKPSDGGSTSYLEALSGASPSSNKASYSPFGSMKLGSSSSQNFSYSPPVATASDSSPKTAQIVVEDRIRTAYTEWCQYFGKRMEDSRMEIFALNFAKAEEFYDSSGTPLMLNEYADMTEEEYSSLPVFE